MTDNFFEQLIIKHIDLRKFYCDLRGEIRYKNILPTIDLLS